MARHVSSNQRRHARLGHRFTAIEAENAHSGLRGRERICVVFKSRRRALKSSNLDEFPEDALPQSYRRACGMAADGHLEVAQKMFERLAAKSTDRRLKSLISNDLAALAVMSGPRAAARERIRRALDLNSGLRHGRLKSGAAGRHVKTDFGENPKKGNDPSGKLDPAVCLLAGG